MLTYTLKFYISLDSCPDLLRQKVRKPAIDYCLDIKKIPWGIFSVKVVG